MPASVPQGRRPARRRGSRWVALAVLALHALLLVGALRLGVWRDRQLPRRDPPPLRVTLLQLPRTAPAAPAVPAPALQPPARAATARVREAEAITLPAAEAAPPLEAPAPPPAPAQAAASEPPRPLDLRLPRRTPGITAQRNPALDDPRANTLRPATVDSRIAAALGGVDGIVEERLADGLMRFRRGNACVLVWPSRAERIDPFNSSFSPKLRGVEGC